MTLEAKLSLMIPGPTPVPDGVLRALGKHPIGHRSGEFQECVARTSEKLKWLHQTKNDVICITGSGTAAMEAGIINTLSKGDKIICGNNGKFGERWVKVAKAYDLDVIEIKSNWGEELQPNEFKDILENDEKKEIKAVVITHSETSTGVINNLQAISKSINSHGALSIIDCVTSLGACNVPVDEWKLDIVASGSQKGYMIPPGLSFLSVSEKAWEKCNHSNLPKFYLDLKAYRKSLYNNSNPFTPSVNLYFALDEALDIMHKEGLNQIFKRHENNQTAIQNAMKAIGLELFAKQDIGSPAVTAVKAIGFDADIFRKKVKENFNILLAGGQDHLKGEIFRIGHLGYIHSKDVISVISAIEVTLDSLGLLEDSVGKGIKAAKKYLI